MLTQGEIPGIVWYFNLGKLLNSKFITMKKSMVIGIVWRGGYPCLVLKSGVNAILGDKSELSPPDALNMARSLIGSVVQYRERAVKTRLDGVEYVPVSNEGVILA